MRKTLKNSREGAVKISGQRSDRLTPKTNQLRSIVQFFRESPLVGVRLDLKGDKDPGRHVQL
jgi:hypothetical protein